MSLKKRFVIAIILMLLIPAVIMLLFTFVSYSFLIMTQRKDFQALLDRGSNFFLYELYPGGAIYNYISVWGIVALATVGVSCGITILYVTKKVLAPLSYLKRAAESIRDGNLDFEILSSNVTEVNDLCVAFNDMRLRLKDSVIGQLKYEQNRSTMLANISHDLRTPVTSIKGYVEGIRDGVTSSPEMTDRYLSTILSKSVVMERMIDQMSDFSELELGKLSFDFKIVDGVEFIKEIIDEYRLDFESAEAELETVFPDAVINVMLDRDKLRRVLINIFSNSIKYRSENPLKVRIISSLSAGGFHIAVCDNGMGIGKGDVNHVFEGFYRGDPSRTESMKGHGLGLSIAKQIVERHRGKIWLKSEIGVGTEVHIHLPVR